MGNVNQVIGTASVSVVSNFDAVGMSPDALIAYCQMQLGNINNQLSGQINQQNRQVQEQKAVNTLKAALEKYGTKGPSGDHPEQMGACVNAFNTAIASLPEGDPLRTDLSSQRDAMITQYGYVPASPTTATAETLSKPPEEGQWQATIEQLTTLSTTIASNSQIGMLQISSLSSAQQTAVEQAVNMLNKRDSTLNDIAKNA